MKLNKTEAQALRNELRYGGETWQYTGYGNMNYEVFQTCKKDPVVFEMLEMQYPVEDLLLNLDIMGY